MKQIKKDNVKKVLAAAGKFAGKKVAPVIGAAAMAFTPAPGVSAQEIAAAPQGSRNPNYNPIVGQLTRAHVIQVYYDRLTAGNKKNDVYIIDIDGDGRTTNDQKVVLTSEQYVGNRRLRVGDTVQFIEDRFSIETGQVLLGDITKTR